MPRSSMTNGYSFVPWVEPRYLTMRRRRVEISCEAAMVQQDHAVRDELLDAVPGQLFGPRHARP